MSAPIALVTGATRGIGSHIAGGDPAEAPAAAVRPAQLPDDGPTGLLFPWDQTIVPW